MCYLYIHCIWPVKFVITMCVSPSEGGSIAPPSTVYGIKALLAETLCKCKTSKTNYCNSRGKPQKPIIIIFDIQQHNKNVNSKLMQTMTIYNALLLIRIRPLCWRCLVHIWYTFGTQLCCSFGGAYLEISTKRAAWLLLLKLLIHRDTSSVLSLSKTPSGHLASG